MRGITVMAFALVISCGDPSSPARDVTLGPLTFSIAPDWDRKDTTRTDWTSSMFTPSDNRRYESLTIIRSRRRDSKNMTLEQLLASAQRGLRDVKITNLRTVRTASGLTGAEISISFKPEGVAQTYRRTHVVLAENDKMFVHVIYTARDPDEEERVLHNVIDSIRVGPGDRS